MSRIQWKQLAFWSLVNRTVVPAIVLLVLLVESVYAQNRVPYSVRPLIESVAAKSHPELMVSWQKMRVSHVEFVAQLLGLYPEHAIYFLARDAEFLYDTARLLVPATDLHRLHLINVSRANSEDALIRDYLGQEGIAEEALRNGKKILLVDTGFAGSIPKKITQYFHEQRKSIQGHLICSNNRHFPSSRVFLMGVDPRAYEMDPSYLESSIFEYELLPHFTDTSRYFEHWEGQIQPISRVGGDAAPSDALKYQEDLKAYLEQTEVQQLFQERHQLWMRLRELIAKPRSRPAVLAILYAVNSLPQNFRVAVLKDLVEFREHALKVDSPIELEDLGLAPKLRSQRLSHLQKTPMDDCNAQFLSL